MASSSLMWLPAPKLFGRWSFQEVKVEDLGLKRYINLHPIAIPHSGGKHERQHFGKADVNIVERLVNSLMRPGRSGGKKLKTINIVKNAFEIVHLKTRENPIQVLVQAIEKSAPCEDVTRMVSGGVVYHIAVDISPQRRVDLALRWIAEGARNASFRSFKPIDECLSDEIISASRGDTKSYAVRKRHELERIALASR